MIRFLDTSVGMVVAAIWLLAVLVLLSLILRQLLKLAVTSRQVAAAVVGAAPLGPDLDPSEQAAAALQDPAVEPSVRALVERLGRQGAAIELAGQLGLDGRTALEIVDRVRNDGGPDGAAN